MKAKKFWIPTFAGMTFYEVCHSSEGWNPVSTITELIFETSSSIYSFAVFKPKDGEPKFYADPHM